MSFARGFNQGVQAIGGMLQLAETVKASKRADAERSAIDKANEAARMAYTDSRSQFEKANQPRQEEVLRLDQAPEGLAAPDLGGGNPSLMAKPGFKADEGGIGAGLGLQVGLDQTIQREQVTRPAAKWDEREGILAGLKARRETLMQNNLDPKHWMDDWGKEANLRAAMRGERIDNAEKRFAATGDPGEYAKAVYPLIDDGFEFVGSAPVKSLDGRQAWEFTRRDQTTGKEVKTVMDADQFQRFMMGVRDPAKVMELEAKSLLERIKASETVRAEEGKQVARQGTERIKSKLKLGEISAEGQEQRRTVAARGSQERLTQKEKPLVLGADATAFGLEDTPEGTKLVPIAKGAAKASQRYTAKDLNTMVIDNYGVSDMAGRPAGSNATQLISAAAEKLLHANPSMGANEAIAKAAKDLNLNATPKN